MRIVFGIVLVMLGLSGATAACARPGGSVPLPATGTVKPVKSGVSGDFRVRADIVTTSGRIDPFADPSGPLRHRFASSMFDYYPLGVASGFRVSGGLRFYEVQNFYGDAMRATGGLLFEPRVTGRNTGMPAGFARHTPAATIGYTGTLKNAVFGVEVGSLLGIANARVPDSFGMGRYRRSGGLNPIANVMFALKF